MAYFEYMVTMRVFHVVEGAFLLVGHTHEEIGRVFYPSSDRACANIVFTLHDLQIQLATVNNYNTTVQYMKTLRKWSGLCTEQH